MWYSFPVEVWYVHLSYVVYVLCVCVFCAVWVSVHSICLRSMVYVWCLCMCGVSQVNVVCVSVYNVCLGVGYMGCIWAVCGASGMDRVCGKFVGSSCVVCVYLWSVCVCVEQ